MSSFIGRMSRRRWCFGCEMTVMVVVMVRLPACCLLRGGAAHCAVGSFPDPSRRNLKIKLSRANKQPRTSLSLTNFKERILLATGNRPPVCTVSAMGSVDLPKQDTFGCP